MIIWSQIQPFCEISSPDTAALCFYIFQKQALLEYSNLFISFFSCMNANKYILTVGVCIGNRVGAEGDDFSFILNWIDT